MRILQLFADKPVSRLAIMGCFAVLMVLPWLHLLPADSALHLSAYWVTLIGKIMCLAMVALALDLVWGYAGILSLGHGLYFALGGYAMGMYLMRQASGNSLPEFMRFLSWDKMPWFWAGTDNFAWAAILVVLVPALVAFIFGFLPFAQKSKTCISRLSPKPWCLPHRSYFSVTKLGLAVTTVLPGLKPSWAWTSLLP